VNGLDIPDDLLAYRIVELVERYPALAEEPYPLTFFEFGTLLAFWHFSQAFA
jgi:dihydrofolate synthase/folylpolyglutamate synthase